MKWAYVIIINEEEKHVPFFMASTDSCYGWSIKIAQFEWCIIDWTGSILAGNENEYSHDTGVCVHIYDDQNLRRDNNWFLFKAAFSWD